MGTITVNGKPLEQHISEEIGREIQQVRATDNPYRRVPSAGSRFGYNLTRTKSSTGRVIYQAGQKATHVIVCGMVFDWLEKGPSYVRSGQSILGGLEYNKANDEVKCHECGEWFNSLGSHVAQRHRIPSCEYKTKHGIAKKRTLNSPRVTERCKSSAKKLFTSGKLTGLTDKCSKLSHDHNTQVANRQIRSNMAVVRARRGMYISLSPETDNLRGRCKEQITDKITEIAKTLGRSPSVRELNENGITWYDMQKLFGARSIAALYKQIGLPARTWRGPKASLTDDQVRCILTRINNGEKQRDIANDYGVFEQVISQIKKGKSYKSPYTDTMLHQYGIA